MKDNIVYEFLCDNLPFNSWLPTDLPLGLSHSLFLPTDNLLLEDRIEYLPGINDNLRVIGCSSNGMDSWKAC